MLAPTVAEGIKLLRPSISKNVGLLVYLLTSISRVASENKKLSYRRETRMTLCISLNMGLVLYE